MSIFKTDKAPDDAKQVIEAGEKMGAPILGQRKQELTPPKGQAGNEAKYRKRHVRMFVCLHCRKTGGTLVKTDRGYVHEDCRSV